MTTSCGLAKFSDVARNISFEQVVSIQLKGMTGLEIKAEVANNSSSRVAMESGVVELFDGETLVATLRQVGQAAIASKTQGVVETMWKIENIDAMSLLKLLSRISKSDYGSMSIGYTAELMADQKRKKVTGKRVDIEKILSTFVL